MLTRLEVEGELRNLGFRATARHRRAEREKARRFVQGVLGVLFGLLLLVLIGAVNLIHTTPAEYASGRSGRGIASEWVTSGPPSARRAPSLFFTGRRTRHPDDPRNRRGGRRADD